MNPYRIVRVSAVSKLVKLKRNNSMNNSLLFRIC